MSKDPKVLILNLPSPPDQLLWRDTAGGFGTAPSRAPGCTIHYEVPLHPFLTYASSVLLNEGYEFAVIDCQRQQLNNDQTVKMVEKENPNIIFSIISLPSMAHDLKLLDQIKESVPTVKIVGVGTVCSILHNEILSSSKIDYVLRNCYPYIASMIDLIRALGQSKDVKAVKGASFLRNGQLVNAADILDNDFNDLPIPNYDFISLDGYATVVDKLGKNSLCIPVLDSKGCPYNCSYCPYPIGYGKKWTSRPVSVMVDEIENLYNSFNVRMFDLRSQSFAYNRKRALDICNELIKRKLDIGWLCETRVDEVNRELLRLMKKAGCERIHYGVETGDPSILKVAKPGVVLDTTRKAFVLTKQEGILTQAHIILGSPDDDHETLENTRRFLLELSPDFMNVNFLTPYPGLKLSEQAKNDSLILTYDWSNYTSYKVVMRTKTLDANQLYGFKKRIIRDFATQKLKQLVSSDFGKIKRPRIFVNKARTCLNKILFPQD